MKISCRRRRRHSGGGPDQQDLTDEISIPAARNMAPCSADGIFDFRVAMSIFLAAAQQQAGPPSCEESRDAIDAELPHKRDNEPILQ
jgi:hypothetical protein